jgi:hypothetical protein
MWKVSSPPDLQEWIERLGAWSQIPFNEWDHAVGEYQQGRREELQRDKAESSFIWPELVKRIKI